MKTYCSERLLALTHAEPQLETIETTVYVVDGERFTTFTSCETTL